MRQSRKQRRAERLAAFETVVSAYEGALIRYAARLLSNYDLAQDVVQDTFIRLYRNWKGDLEPCPQVSSWLYRVAHNRAVDLLRKQNRRRRLHEQHARESPDHVPPNRGTGFRISADAERAAAALEVLDLRERQLVILKVYEEKSYREIAEIAGLSTGNVGYILHHAMKKLARELDGAKTP